LSETSIDTANKGILLSGRTYDILKDVNLVGLPALATLYATLALIWHWPFSEQIVGTIAAIVLFMGVILKISSVQYKAKVAALDTEFMTADSQ
jgi:hypothetical protein